MEFLLFYLFAGTALVMAMVMIVSRKAVTSAVSLIVVMFCLAGLFAMQSAHLIAALQILVYAGAIMVLFIFVIMLLNLREKGGMISGRQPVIQIVSVAILWGLLGPLVAFYDLGAVANKSGEASDGFGGTSEVGEILYTDYLLPFEIASVLLLAALVGAVILTKTNPR